MYVPEYLSAEWISDANVAARDLTTEDAIVVEYRVDEIVYHVSIGDESGVSAGPAVAPDVVLSLSYAAAASIAQGTQSAQAAFMAGNLRLGGDAMALVRANEHLESAADPFADLRSRTTYDHARIA